MAATRKQNCWDIMHCDEEDLCPVRVNKIKRCWEYMEKNRAFQCRYGLCYECIVYLCNNENSVLTDKELEDVMRNTDFFQQGF